MFLLHSELRLSWLRRRPAWRPALSGRCRYVQVGISQVL